MRVDFVSLWKASSIVLTGAFGILGLATEFRNKHTHRITKWGYASLFGIIVSTVGGTIAQLKQASDDAAKALKIAEKSDATLTNVARLLTPAHGFKIDATFEVDCSDSLYAPQCAQMRERHLDYVSGSDERNPFRKISERINILFIHSRQELEDPTPGIYHNVINMQAILTVSSPESTVWSDPQGKRVELGVVAMKTDWMVSDSDSFSSVKDFKNALVQIRNIDGGVTPIKFSLLFADGEEMNAVTPFETETSVMGTSLYISTLKQ